MSIDAISEVLSWLVIGVFTILSIAGIGSTTHIYDMFPDMSFSGCFKRGIGKIAKFSVFASLFALVVAAMLNIIGD